VLRQEDFLMIEALVKRGGCRHARRLGDGVRPPPPVRDAEPAVAMSWAARVPSGRGETRTSPRFASVDVTTPGGPYLASESYSTGWLLSQDLGFRLGQLLQPKVLNLPLDGLNALVTVRPSDTNQNRAVHVD